MPIPLIIVLAVLFLLALLLAVRVRVVVNVQQSASVELHVLFLRFRLYPRRKKLKPRSEKKLERLKRKQAKKQAKKLAKKQAKQEKKKQKKKALAEKGQKPKTLGEKLRFVRRLLIALTRRTRKHLRLHAARLHVRIGTGDAAKTAVTYGAAAQSLSYVLVALDRVTRLRACEPEVSLIPDFTAERSDVDLCLVLSIRVIGALCVAFGTVFSLLSDKLGSPFQKKRRAQKKPLKKTSDKKGI